MLSFKSFLSERRKDVPTFINQIKNGPFSYIDPDTGEEVRVDDRHDLKEYLEKVWGATMIGAGHYSVAIAGERKEVVVKILKEYDENYIKYAELSINKHSSNPLFPEILHSLSFNKDRIFIVEYITTARQAGHSNKHIQFLANDHTLDILWEAYKSGGENTAWDSLVNDIQRGLTERGKALKAVNFNIENFLDWCNEMENERFSEESSDLHSQNWGVRADGSLVIFDPVG